MPAIIIRDYTWRQTAQSVIVYVPLMGCTKKVDLFATENYIKTSFSPFILELFLWSSIIEDKSTCTLSKEQVVLTLQKTNEFHWESLQTLDLTKAQKRQIRECAMQRARTCTEERAEIRKEKKRFLHQEGIRAQIDLDTTTLNQISERRDTHRREAMKDLEDWRTQVELPILKDIEGKMQKNLKAYKPPLKWFKDEAGVVKSRAMTKEEIFKKGIGNVQNKQEDNSSNEVNVEKEDKVIQNQDNSKDQPTATLNADNNNKLEECESDLDNESSDSEDSESDCESNLHSTTIQSCLIKEMDEKALQKFYAKKKRELPGKELVDRILKGRPLRMNKIFDDSTKATPLPRKSGTINVTFSKRVFPTPARESAHLEEQEWLSKQAEARRKTGFVAEDLRPEEQDPQWLKDKGDEFFKAGNYLAAISAYTHGIKISDKLTSLYVNRSAAHYAIGNYYRCTEDCSKALELMEPKCASNRDSRARCHARRGAALCKLSAPQHGISELEEALKLTPDNESIKRDLHVARQYFEIKE